MRQVLGIPLQAMEACEVEKAESSEGDSLQQVVGKHEVLFLDFPKVFQNTQESVGFKYWDSGINVNENLLIDLGRFGLHD